MVMKRFTPMVALTALLCLCGTAFATQYKLSATAGTGGTVSVMVSFGGVAKAWADQVSLMLEEGSEVTLTPAADTGYHFVRWIGTVGFNDPILKFLMLRDWDLQACFEPDQPTLTVTTGLGGTVTQPGVGIFSYSSGTNVVITAKPLLGYRFLSWTGTAVQEGKVADPCAASTFVTMDSNYSLQANFEERQVTLSVSAGAGGSILIPGIGNFTYVQGLSAVISAKAATGYHFVGWTGSAVDALKVVDPTSSVTTVTMDDDYSVQANFAGNQHTLVLSWTSGGSVTAVTTLNGVSTTLSGQGSFLVEDGTTVQMTATPESGWYFSQWSGAPEASGNTVKFTMTADRTIQAYFAQDPRSLVISAGTGGKVTEPGVGTFTYQRGTLVAIEATPNAGYRFTKWTGTIVDGNDLVDRTASRTTIIVDESGTLQANFEVITQDLTECWESTAGGIYTPSDAAFLGGDAGFWALTDGYTCGTTPHKATILTLDDDHALMLTSVDSGSSCSDRVSVKLSADNKSAPWTGIGINADTVISFDEVGKLCSAGLHATVSKDGSDLPAYDNVSLVLTDNNGNVLVYVLQRYAQAAANLSATNVRGTYQEIFLDTKAIKYQRNLYTDFLSIPAFKADGAMLKSIEFKIDAHGMAILDNLTIGSGAIVEKTPIYRFWSLYTGDHFYTAAGAEMEKVSNSSSWIAEGIAYFALPYGSDPNTSPVYRFWSPILGTHFYTISENEKNKLLTTMSDIWSFEGVHFYAYSAANRPADAVPVYRFWSDILGDHFYTTYEPERDKVISMDPRMWIYEDIAWYAYAPWPYAKVLDTQTCPN